MALRFQTAPQVQALPDEAIDSTFECIMPKIDIANPYGNLASNGALGAVMNMFTSALTTYQPIVEEIVFGVTNFKTNTRRVRTMWCNVPEDIQNYHDASITFFVSANMLTQYYLAAWRSLVYNEEGEYYNPMSVYKKNIEVFVYGPGNIGISGIAAAHFTLKGCWPATQDNYRFEYKDEPQRMRITAQFKVDKVVYNGMTARTAMVAELATSPTSILDKATTLLFNESSNYSTFDTYGYSGIENDMSRSFNSTNSDIASDNWMDDTVIEV